MPKASSRANRYQKPRDYGRRADRPNLPRPARKVLTSTAARAQRDALITDHAIIRWLERIVGIDIGRQVRDAILETVGEARLREIDNANLWLPDHGVQFVIRNGRVITVRTKDMREAAACR